jgi:hypothetical protein
LCLPWVILINVASPVGRNGRYEKTEKSSVGLKRSKLENLTLLEPPKDLVLFNRTQRHEADGDIQFKSASLFDERVFGLPLERLQDDWTKVVSQIRKIFEITPQETPQGFALDSVEISLGFSAKGRLVFIAEAGVEATVNVTFKRSSAATSG